MPLMEVLANLNIRDRGEVLETVPAGAVLTVTDTIWREVELEDGSIGLASGKYLRVYEGEIEKAPEPATVDGVIYQRELPSRYGQPRDPAPYLKTIDLSGFKEHLTHVRDFNGKAWSCRIYGHQILEAPLKLAFVLLISRGYAGELRTFDGCLCIRLMTGSRSPSVHSWGLALDFNASSNRYGARPTLSSGFVKCFTDAGFEWGGNWRTPDGMHFQLPRTS